jgi:hypothetical protein
MTRPYQIVLDTNVLLAGLRSNRGASYKLLTLQMKEEGIANKNARSEFRASVKKKMFFESLVRIHTPYIIYVLCIIILASRGSPGAKHPDSRNPQLGLVVLKS